ncbi:MAG: histidinol dehydrogenase [Methanocellales archaeon]
MTMIREITELDEGELSHVLRRDLALESVFLDVEKIIEDVKKNGDAAIKKYTKKFDGVDLKQIQVEREELNHSLQAIDFKLRKSLEIAAENIKVFHQRQLEKKIWLTYNKGIILGEKITPLESIGIYIPGGRALYPSTVLMTAIPAKIAGVNRIAMCTPPRGDGSVHPVILAAAQIAGVNEIYKVGGVQAIAALAYGTESIKKVDKIIGPGNIYVTAAKLLIKKSVEIDFPAGPSEVVIVADEYANPKFIAIDMIAQAEHDPSALSILITPSREIAEKVESELKLLLKKVKRREIIEASLKQSQIFLVKDLDMAVELLNMIAPEHVQLMLQDYLPILDKVKHAGTIFIGDYSPVALGDYASGANHVLPAAGYARVYSGLNLDHFIKKTTIQMASKEGLKMLKDIIITLAEVEGLHAHVDSIRERFK